MYSSMYLLQYCDLLLASCLFILNGNYKKGVFPFPWLKPIISTCRYNEWTKGITDRDKYKQYYILNFGYLSVERLGWIFVLLLYFAAHIIMCQIAAA